MRPGLAGGPFSNALLPLTPSRATPPPPTPNPNPNRLQNEIRARDRELDAARKEATALKSAAAAKERMLQTTAAEVARLKERALKAEGEAGAAAKELAALRADKRKADAGAADLSRQVDRLKQKVSELGARQPNFSEQVARLEAEARAAKLENQRLADEARAVANQLRAKDRELGVAQNKLAWAAQVEARSKELENDVLAGRRAAEQAVGEMRTLQNVRAGGKEGRRVMGRGVERWQHEGGKGDMYSPALQTCSPTIRIARTPLPPFHRSTARRSRTSAVSTAASVPLLTHFLEGVLLSARYPPTRLLTIAHHHPSLITLTHWPLRPNPLPQNPMHARANSPVAQPRGRAPAARGGARAAVARQRPGQGRRGARRRPRPRARRRARRALARGGRRGARCGRGAQGRPQGRGHDRGVAARCAGRLLAGAMLSLMSRRRVM